MTHLTVAVAQLKPCWFHREQTIAKIQDAVAEAASQQCQLVVFGEALIPGYPFWIERTDGARFNDERQKTIQAEYATQAVQIERGDLEGICKQARQHQIAIYLGIIERPSDRTGHSLYCSLVFIDNQGIVQSVHRKLMPTHEERLSWSIGDGNGLVTHPVGDFTLGGLNCWENWMPLARTALYSQGENVHIAVWPGNLANTQDITRFMAMEGRSYVISACGVLSPADVENVIPELTSLKDESCDYFAAGGSCIANPDGSWLLEPQLGEENIYVAELDAAFIKRERHHFDPCGHYSRPDVLQLKLNRTRQSNLIVDED